MPVKGGGGGSSGSGLSVTDGVVTVNPTTLIRAGGGGAAGVQVLDAGGGEADFNVNVSDTNWPTSDEKAALDAAAAPTGGNPFATIADLPAAGTTQIRSTYAARPAAGTAGRIWLQSDGPLMAFDDGANWQDYFGSFPLSDPTVVNNWLNQGGASIATTFGRIILTGTLNDTQVRAREIALPHAAPNYRVKFLISAIISEGNSRAGIFVRDHVAGTIVGIGFLPTNGGEVFHMDNTAYLNYARYASGFGEQYPFFHGPTYFQIREDGVTRYFEVSHDDIAYRAVYTQAVGTFVTPTRCGFYVEDTGNVVVPIAVVFSYEGTTV